MKTLDKSMLDRILDPREGIFTADVARKLVDDRLITKVQTPIDKLARRCNASTMTEKERREYEPYVPVIDFISILQAKARSYLKRSSDE